uniref:Uncharacterized protein n=1 Tax=Cyphia phyteuma TaxID=2041120 RepID=A0A291F4M1_9ASTR|nr:hypothetical protein Cyp_phy1Pt0597 [Cyphia phyteuma]ATG27104.1 hypothetical protein Cyp_phy1Pt0597 [Cyphia phyteuma]
MPTIKQECGTPQDRGHALEKGKIPCCKKFSKINGIPNNSIEDRGHIFENIVEIEKKYENNDKKSRCPFFYYKKYLLTCNRKKFALGLNKGKQIWENNKAQLNSGRWVYYQNLIKSLLCLLKKELSCGSKDQDDDLIEKIGELHGILIRGNNLKEKGRVDTGI